VILALENPLNDPNGTLTLVLKILDPIITSIFVFEVLVRVIANGFIINGKKSYLKDSWHVIDFTIVVFSLFSLFPFFGNYSLFKIIRMVRLFRPLRIISRNENLKLSIQALVVSIPAIASLMVIVVFVMFIFAIVSVNLFKGKSFYCNTDSITNLSVSQI
jgi:hypothetical protein